MVSIIISAFLHVCDLVTLKLNPNLRGAWWIEKHRELKEKRGSWDFGFIGDSHAMNMPFDSRVINLGIGGDETYDIEWRIKHGALKGKKIKTLYLSCGANDIIHKKGSAESIAYHVMKLYWLLDEQPEIENVVLVKIPEAKDNVIYNGTVSNVNLFTMVPEYYEVNPVDYRPDGLHLGAETYTKFLSDMIVGNYYATKGK